MALKKGGTPIKSIEGSTLTHDEGEELHNEVTKLKGLLQELQENAIKKIDLVNSQLGLENKIAK